MIVGETDKVIKELFESLLTDHQKYLEESMKGSDFKIACVHSFY